MKATVIGYYLKNCDCEFYEEPSVKRAREMGEFLKTCGADRVVIKKENGEWLSF